MRLGVRESDPFANTQGQIHVRPASRPSFRQPGQPLLQRRDPRSRHRHPLQGRRAAQRRGILHQRRLGEGRGRRRQGSLRSADDDHAQGPGRALYPRQRRELKRAIPTAVILGLDPRISDDEAQEPPSAGDARVKPEHDACHSSEALEEEGRAAIAAIGHQRIARDGADLGPAQPLIEPPRRAGLVRVEAEAASRPAANALGLRCQHQRFADTLPARGGMHQHLGNIGAVRLVRLAGGVELRGADDLVALPRDQKQDLSCFRRRLRHLSNRP